MKKLLDYINSMPTKDRVEFENSINTTIAYLRKAISIDQKINIRVCIAIEKATCGSISCEDLRPDIDWKFLRSPQEA